MFLYIVFSFFIYIFYKLLKGDIECVYGSILGTSGAEYPNIKNKGDAVFDKDGFNIIKNSYDQKL
nr:hypothetical protein [uncultured Vibrio sp.]